MLQFEGGGLYTVIYKLHMCVTRVNMLAPTIYAHVNVLKYASEINSRKESLHTVTELAHVAPNMTSSQKNLGIYVVNNLLTASRTHCEVLCV